MNYGFISNGICINTAVYANEEEAQEARTNFDPIEFDELVPCEAGFGIGHFYVNNTWMTEMPKTAVELREQAYESMTLKVDGVNLITWEGNAITVDQANKAYLEYLAEGSPKAAEIQALIVTAKTYIRELYPDAE